MAGTPSPIRPSKEAYPLENVRRQVQVQPRFTAAEFERAFDSFIQTYNVLPTLARCSPDVLDRYCGLYERSPDVGRRREVRFRGIPLLAAVLPVNTLVLEGEVDDVRMGDW